MKTMMTDREIFLNWLAENNYFTIFFGRFYKVHGTNGAYSKLNKIINTIKPIDYVYGLLNMENETDVNISKDLDEIDEKWVNFVNTYYKYEPKRGDYVYVSFIDDNGWERAWISIVDRISKDDSIIEVASGCYKQPDDEPDELEFLNYDCKNETYQFVRKATEKEIKWLNDLMKDDGTAYVDGKLELF